MSTSWTKQEDAQLIEWVEKGIKKGWNLRYLFIFIARKLQRTPEECTKRWYMLSDQKWYSMQRELVQLFQVIRDQQKEIDKMKQDMQFYELMLLESYHILLKLLGEEPMIRIHRI